jgi:CHAT domain-containing protein
VEQVAATWSVTPPAGPATADDLRSALGTHDVVHVAAHATHHVESPVFSSVWMADGPVFLCDLERTEIAASHVVISACEAGQSRRRGPSHHLGLATGLLTLGVGSVVASPCRVPDATAAEVMTGYHRLLAAGHEAAEALATASAAVDLPLAGAFVAWGGPWSAPTAVA